MLRTITKVAYISKACHRNLDALLSQLRWLYNESLAERKRAWEECKESVSLYDQFKTLTKRREAPEWSRYPVDAQRSILQRLDRAYKHFFREGGYPRFKSWRNGIHSFELDSPPKVVFSGSAYSVKIKGVGRFKFQGRVFLRVKVKACAYSEDTPAYPGSVCDGVGRSRCVGCEACSWC